MIQGFPSRSNVHRVLARGIAASHRRKPPRSTTPRARAPAWIWMTDDSPFRSRYLRACCQCLAATDLRLGTFRRGPWALNELRRSLAGVSIDREWVAARVGITERTLPNQGRIGNARESAGKF